jgi:hypothetical protein
MTLDAVHKHTQHQTYPKTPLSLSNIQTTLMANEAIWRKLHNRTQSHVQSVVVGDAGNCNALWVH